MPLPPVFDRSTIAPRQPSLRIPAGATPPITPQQTQQRGFFEPGTSRILRAVGAGLNPQLLPLQQQVLQQEQERIRQQQEQEQKGRDRNLKFLMDARGKVQDPTVLKEIDLKIQELGGPDVSIIPPARSALPAGMVRGPEGVVGLEPGFAEAKGELARAGTAPIAPTPLGKMQTRREQLESKLGQTADPNRQKSLRRNISEITSTINKDLKGGKGDTFKQASTLRKEYLQQSERFIDVRDAHGRVLASGKDPSAAGDLALVFNYMKVLDPDSVVRESEFATAQNSAGVPDRIRNVYNKVLSGERLNPNQRKDFINRSGKLFDQQKIGQKKLISEFSRIAQSNEVPKGDVIVDFFTLGNQDQVINDARDAIQKGADPEEVKQRLQGMGIDPGVL